MAKYYIEDLYKKIVLDAPDEQMAVEKYINNFWDGTSRSLVINETGFKHDFIDGSCSVVDLNEFFAGRA